MCEINRAGDGHLTRAVQADVQLDQERCPRAVALQRSRQALGCLDAVDRHGQLHARGGDPGQPVALLGTERRVVHEDARRAGLVEDLGLAGLRDGQATGPERQLTQTDLR